MGEIKMSKLRDEVRTTAIPSKAKRPRKPKAEDPMTTLARISLEERAEKSAEAQRKKQGQEVALAQLHQQEANDRARAARIQRVCDHLLGNHRVGVIPQTKRCGLHKDYLSDKSVRIYCGKCRFDWKPGDRSEYIIRHGERIPNPTRQSWKQINEFFYSFENSRDLTSRAYRIERVEPEDSDARESPAA
jgi:hypothetical protein